ncbi:MAG: amidophosphoribosyltransferase [Bacteriovoracaceae bacterium]|nr:amidophosphoribosyltransferase [Bacteriovoracaceae bacterium]
MCGVVGIIGTPMASQEVMQGLALLQHRGQDSAGILSYSEEQKRFLGKKALGQVADVFRGVTPSEISGRMSIGHARYSTVGSVKESDLQPLIFTHPVGLAIVQNGNLSNYSKLKQELLQQRRSFTTDNDLEAILHLMAPSFQNLHLGEEVRAWGALVDAMENVFAKADGGYALVGMVGDSGLFGVRDIYGIRPLVFGERTQLNGEKSYGFASESCALKYLGFENIRDVNPGELIWITEDGKLKSKILAPRKTDTNPRPCMFEFIYFSSADSVAEGKSVYDVRVKLGYQLGKKIKNRFPDSIPFDVVMPVPDTSRAAALGVAETINIPYREGLLKNRYVQRSFIQNNQTSRKSVVNLKFSVVESIVKDKNILLVDDSVVRGTTSQKIIQMLLSQGAKSVSLASSCPPVRHPCYYGIDFSTYEELMAAKLNEEQIAERIGAKYMIYTDINDISESLKTANYCRACLDGSYAYPKN